jgi:ATP-dependent RNA circularization protein (DNA/RNA ligase family)
MYGLEHGELDFYVYDIVYQDGAGNTRYLNIDTTKALCHKLGMNMCPELYVGEFKPELLDMRLGNTTIEPMNHVREGIVIRTLEERTNPILGRMILKRVSEDYLMRNKPKDDEIE